MHDPAREFILRAMAASEIAESCPNLPLRRDFQDLAAYWLRRAAEAGVVMVGGAAARAST